MHIQRTSTFMSSCGIANIIVIYYTSTSSFVRSFVIDMLYNVACDVVVIRLLCTRQRVDCFTAINHGWCGNSWRRGRRGWQWNLRHRVYDGGGVSGLNTVSFAISFQLSARLSRTLKHSL